MTQGGNMRVDFPGLTEERLPSGNKRWRVRVEGARARKITLPFGPEHPDFDSHYRAARAGERLSVPQDTGPDRGTLGWLATAYLKHLGAMVEAKDASALTLKERVSLTTFLLGQQSEQPKSRGKEYRGLPAVMPAAELHALKDRMAATPGKARNVWKLLIALYDFGVDRGYCSINPARAVPRPTYRSAGGATPWTVEDLDAYRDRHQPGTMAHLALTLFMFTACRIGDAYRLGRQHETRHAGQLWLDWQPAKKGSRRVTIPVLAPLERAIRAQTIVGPTYLLTEAGKPFASPEALRNWFKKRCREAGLEDRSSHGIRKAAGHILALNGATQYEIMSVHGHANASTSQVYTESVERMRLGEMAASRLAAMDW